MTGAGDGYINTLNTQWAPFWQRLRAPARPSTLQLQVNISTRPSRKNGQTGKKTARPRHNHGRELFNLIPCSPTVPPNNAQPRQQGFEVPVEFSTQSQSQTCHCHFKTTNRGRNQLNILMGYCYVEAPPRPFFFVFAFGHPFLTLLNYVALNVQFEPLTLKIMLVLGVHCTPGCHCRLSTTT